MNVTKKVLSAFIAGTMAAVSMAGAVPEIMPDMGANVSVSAELYSDLMELNNLNYKKVDSDEDGVYDYVVILQSFSYQSEEIVIPSEIDGLPVKKIGADAFAGYWYLKNITIPDTVTDIGAYAFSDCYDLKSITIPDSVTSIGEYAFCACESLESVVIPDSVAIIAGTAFDSTPFKKI